MAIGTYIELIKLIRSGKRLGVAFDQRLKEYGITLSQWELMLHLMESGSLRQKDLANRIGVAPAAIVQIVDRLERDGWVKRKTNQSDDRSHLITLTEFGKKRSEKVTEVMKRASQDFTSGVSRTDIEVLSEVLGRILQNIGKE